MLKNYTETGNPFYVYDEKVIYENIDRFKSIPYTNTSIHFASMANDNPVLLKMLKNADIGLFVNSMLHLEMGQCVGFDSDKIIFASTGISKNVLKTLIKNNIQVNIDSVNQLELYGKLNPNGTVGIRLNIDEKSKNNIFTGLESRIGVLESELPDIFNIAEKYNLKLNGAHVYLGTDVVSLDDLLQGVEQTISLSNQFVDLEFIDFGGGFPLNADRFDFVRYSNIITNKMEQLSNQRNKSIKLILEPGRAMFGNSGHFYMQVTDVKERPDRYIVCVNASASLIPRAMFYEDYNPATALTDGEVFDKPVDITGNTTYSRDFISKGTTLNRVAIGDWIRLDDAGSYCYSMITRFLGQEFPVEFLKKIDGKIIAIRNSVDLDLDLPNWVI